MNPTDGEVEKSLVEQIPSLIHDLRNPLQQLSASMELYRSQVSVLLFGMLSGCIEEMNQLISQAMEKFEKISRKQGSSLQTCPQNIQENEPQSMNSSKRTDLTRDMQSEDASKREITDIRMYLEEFWQRNLAVIELKPNVDYEILIQEEEMPLYFALPKLEVNRVLQNLFSNASKFTHNGYIKLLASFIQTSQNTPLQLKQQLNQQHINTKSGQLNQQSLPSKTIHFKTNTSASCWKKDSNQIQHCHFEGIQNETRTERWSEMNRNISKSDRINNRPLSSSSSSSGEHNMSAMMEESSNSSKILGSFHNSTPPAFQVRTFSQISQASNRKQTTPVKDPPYAHQLSRPTNENSSGDIQLEQIPQIKQATSEMDGSGSPPGQEIKRTGATTAASCPIQGKKQQQQDSNTEDSPMKFQQIISKRKSQIHPSIRDLVNNTNNTTSTMSISGANSAALINKTHLRQKITSPASFSSEIQGYLKFEVADTGRGMTEEEMSKIFESFQQANPSIKQLYGGSGIGLFSAKTIAQKIGGDIICHSESNVGSTFIFYFPCTGSSKKVQPREDKEENDLGFQEAQLKINEISRAQRSTIKSVKNGLMKADLDAAIQRESALESLDAKEKLALGKIVIELGRRRRVVKLLYVDDSQFLLESMKSRLLRIGCVDVTIESSSSKVINSYFSIDSRNNTFDVILIDYSMSEMNGNQLAAAIKAKQEQYQPQQQKSVLVCFTGYSINDKQFKAQGIESGFSLFLQKPASLLQVLTILLEALKIPANN